MFTSILDTVLQDPSIAPHVASYNGFVASLGNLFPFIMIALCLFVGLFGRRFSGLIRVALLFAIGFVASAYWLTPLLKPYVPQANALIVGLVVGLLAAVLSRMIYNLVYIGCIGFDVYNICFNAIFFAEITATTKGNLPLCIGVAVVAVAIALFLRKYLEMIITAAAGGVGVAFFAKTFFDYTTVVQFDPNMTMLVVGAVVAVPLFIYQYYNRAIY